MHNSKPAKNTCFISLLAFLENKLRSQGSQIFFFTKTNIGPYKLKFYSKDNFHRKKNINN